MKTPTALLMCVVALTAMSSAQQKPCSSKDQGPFLATLPTLTMTVNEASQAELTVAPNRYRAEVKLYGEVGSQGSQGIVLEVMPDYVFMNPEDYFRFKHDQGFNYLQMDKPVDRDGPTTAIDDDTNVFGFTLKCSLQSNMSDFVFYSAKIFVLDVNDNDPEFINLTSTLTLNELTPPGVSVLTVKAADLDISSNLTYSLVQRADLADDMSGFFTVDRMSGQLTVSTGLDYETMAQGSLVISVQDGGSPPRTATATVAVTVEDGDDQGPVFVYPGCWTHQARCAWPKYTTTTTSLTQGQPINVLPVPNKVQTNVIIKAKDLDHSANPIVFSIASTIPPGQENMFTVSTALISKGEYAATITPTSTFKVNHGFEIFLRAQEQSHQRRFEVAMIFFEDPSHVTTAEVLPITATTTTTTTTSSGQSGTNPDNSGSSANKGDDDNNNNNNNNNNKDDEKYTEPVIALIVVVAILAAFVLCLALAFLCTLRNSSARQNDVTLTRM